MVELINVPSISYLIVLTMLNCTCLSVVVSIVPGVVTLIINTLQFLHFIHQSLSKSNILAIVLPLMLLRSGMNSLIMCAVPQLPPSGKSSKLICLQKPIRHSHPCHAGVLLVMTWLCHWINVNCLVLCSDAP